MANNVFTDAPDIGEIQPALFTEKLVRKKSGQQITSGEQRPNFLHLEKTGKAKPTIENVEALLNFLGVVVEHNVINKRMFIRPALGNVDLPFSGKICDDSAVAFLASKGEEFDLNTKRLDSYLENISTRSPVNPVKDWIEAKPWDGVSRIGKLCATVQVKENTGYRDLLITTWMAQAIAILFSPKPIQARGVLVFQGKQHRGKTLWFKSLFPEPIDSYAKEGMSVEPNNRDSVMACLRYWAVELGELNGIFKKSDMESLKRFIGATSDVWRLPYGKMDSEMPRRTVFYASVNDPIFLRDNENTRFWTIEVDGCDEKHGIDMQQVWAQVLYDWKAGLIKHTLSPEEMKILEDENKKFTVASPIEEKILQYYDWEDRVCTRWITATQVAIELGINNPHHGDIINIGRVLHELGCPTRRVNGAKQIAVPDKKII
jgi:putative DNA primase/helicase